MKEYRLTAWPDLGPPYDRTVYRRMLSEMSQRHASLARLVGTSGLKRNEVRIFVDMLNSRGMLVQRESLAIDSMFGSLRPLGSWLRRALATAHLGR
jgi:hypothetical protein